MVCGQSHRTLEVTRQGGDAEDRDGERLLGDPPLPEPFEHLGDGVGLFGQRKGRHEGFRHLRRVGLLPDPPDRLAYGGVEGITPADAVDDHGECAGGQVSGRMAVGEARSCHGDPEGAVGPPVLVDEPAGCRAHDAATALAVVGGPPIPISGLSDGAQSRQARVAGGSTGPQGRDSVELAVPDDLLLSFFRSLTLGVEPALVGRAEHAGRVGDAAVEAVVGLQEALRGEEGHLGVVGEGAHASVDLDGVSDAVRTEPTSDRRKVVELNSRTEGIAHSAPEEAAAIAVERSGCLEQGP